MTLEEGLELIENYKKGLQKFLNTLPEQAVQIGSEMEIGRASCRERVYVLV